MITLISYVGVIYTYVVSYFIRAAVFKSSPRDGNVAVYVPGFSCKPRKCRDFMMLLETVPGEVVSLTGMETTMSENTMITLEIFQPYFWFPSGRLF